MLSRRGVARRGPATKFHHENAASHNFTHYEWVRLNAILGFGVSRIGRVTRL